MFCNEAPKFISIPLLDHIRMKFDKYESALKLAKFLIAKDTSWESTEAVKNKSETRFHKYGHLFQEQKPDGGERMQSGAKRFPETPLFLATKSGCIEIVQEILEAYPQAVEYVDEKGRMILHVAIKYCQTQIFRLVQGMKLPRKRLKRKVTNEGNSILHMVGLKDKEVLGDMRSPALLLQERLLFFEMVKSICKADMVKLLNSEGHTAEEVFNCTHAQLRSDAKDWLKRTAENCTIVAVLISTVAFAAAYTIPGGPNQSTGYPVLLHKTFFVVFTIADVLSITLALTSTITFLAVLMSPFHMKDFKRSLPQTLMLGISLLILSVTMMMLAFAATVILMISNKERWTKIALSCMSFIPVTKGTLFLHFSTSAPPFGGRLVGEMANLRTAIDAAFYDLNVSTSRTLDGMVRSIPGDPIPMDGSRASRVLRIQQLSLLGNGFPLGLVPSFSPPSKKELGPLALQTVFFKAAISKWWVGLVGQVRPKKLISKLKAEIEVIKADIRKITDDDDWEFELPIFLPIFKNLHKCFLDKSFYSLGVNSHIPLTDSSSLLLSMEQPGEEGCRRMKAMYMHKLSDHDVTLEAAWPERFIDHKGRYWDIPESISLDCSSLDDLTGWKYRFGIHKNSGQPVAVDNTDDAVHPALMPGLCAKVAFSYEKHKDLWREVEREKDVLIRTEEGLFFRPAYDVRLREPHAKISGIIGGTCAAWVGGGNNSLITESREDRENTLYSRRRPFGVDLFGSFCYTLQHGKFRKRYNDLTRIDARLDVSSAVAIAKRVSRIFRSASNTRDSLSTPRLNLIFQQQVAGPIVFRLDSRFCIDSIYGVPVPKLEDYVLSLDYSLRLLHSGKVVAWYSPKRKEAMVELRLFEF